MTLITLTREELYRRVWEKPPNHKRRRQHRRRISTLERIMRGLTPG